MTKTEIALIIGLYNLGWEPKDIVEKYPNLNINEVKNIINKNCNK